MLLQVKRTEDGLVARRAERGFDRGAADGSDQLRPLLLALAAGTGGGSAELERWTVGELLEGFRRVAVVPPGPGFPPGTAGVIASKPLFEDRTLLWMDAERGRLAIHTSPDRSGVFVFDAGAPRLAEYPDMRLALSRRSFTPRGASARHQPGPGCWRLDDVGFEHLSAWTPDNARLELRLDARHIELVSVGSRCWRPARAPGILLPGLGWPPGLVPWTRAWLRWQGGSCPVVVTGRGPDTASVSLPDPVPEELTWVVEVRLAEGPDKEVVRTLQAEASWPVATAFSTLRVEAGGAEVDVVTPGATLGDLVLAGPEPHPRVLSLRVTRPGPKGPGPVHEVACALETSENGERATYRCADLGGLLQIGGEPAEIRFASPGQDELGSLVVLPPDIQGRWRPTDSRALGWVAEGSKLPSRLVRPAVSKDGRTVWAAVGQAIAGPGILRSRHDLRIGGRRRTQRLRLCWSEPPRLRRMEPWNPIRISGVDDYVEVDFVAPGDDGTALRIWVPSLPPVEVPPEEAPPGQLRVLLPRGIAGGLGQDCARIEVVGAGSGPGPWGWVHRNVDPGPGPWRDVRSDGDVVLLPQDGALFVDLHGLCSAARMEAATARGLGAATVLRLETPWPVDGLMPLGVDGAMLAPVQAAMSEVPDGRQSHLWLQDALRDPIHLVLEQRGGRWVLASVEGPKGEGDQLGSLGRAASGLQWLPRRALGFEQSETCLVWRNRLLLVSPPERPRILFAGWVWPAGETVVEDGGPLGSFGLGLDPGTVSSRSWEGVDDSGFAWTTPPPPEVLAAPELRAAARDGADPTRPLVFEVEIGGEPVAFTLMAKTIGSAFDPMRLTLVEGAAQSNTGLGPLRVWRRQAGGATAGSDAAGGER